MKSLNVKLVVATLTLFVATIGISSSARADFSISVDCYGNGGVPTWAETKGTLYVTAWFGPYNNFIRKSMDGDAHGYCDKEGDRYLHFQIVGAEWNDINRIQVTNSSRDCFWIDDITVYDEDLNKKHTWGADNNCGWCIDTDENTNKNKCYPCNGSGWSNDEMDFYIPYDVVVQSL